MPIQVPDVEMVYKVACLVKYGWRLYGDSWVHPQGNRVSREGRWPRHEVTLSEFWTLDEAFEEVFNTILEAPNATPG
jgi:hypothetical protein